MKQYESLERKQHGIEKRRSKNNFGRGILGIVGGIALVGIAALVVVALPDIKRYIKISSM
ncbi:MAG: DUF6893 family small protein [Pyrinomonadaceae bacterium]